MEQLNDKWWWKLEQDGVYQLGLTAATLKRYGIVWNLIPRDGDEITSGTPLVNIESSNSLCPLLAPISGKIVEWNQQVLEAPDILTNETYLLKVQV